MKQLLNTSLLLTIIFTLSSCSSLSPFKVPVLQGNIYEQKDLDNLSEGLTMEQVQFIFGTALIKDPFHRYRWDYYNSVQIGDKKITETKLTINFDDDGLVENWIEEKITVPSGT
tara:strand:- start:1251 stop:1592 length:342 start_codon:yes stop_codon:yes gene_type:complete